MVFNSKPKMENSQFTINSTIIENVETEKHLGIIGNSKIKKYLTCWRKDTASKKYNICTYRGWTIWSEWCEPWGVVFIVENVYNAAVWFWEYQVLKIPFTETRKIPERLFLVRFSVFLNGLLCALFTFDMVFKFNLGNGLKNGYVGSKIRS